MRVTSCINRKAGHMAQAKTQAPTPGDIENQIKTIRDDISTLTGLLKDLAEAKVGDAQKTAMDEAEDLLKRTRAATDDATAKAKQAAGSVEDYIADKPVQATLIALLIGILVGSLSRR